MRRLDKSEVQKYFADISENKLCDQDVCQYLQLQFSDIRREDFTDFYQYMLHYF